MPGAHGGIENLDVEQLLYKFPADQVCLLRRLGLHATLGKFLLLLDKFAPLFLGLAQLWTQCVEFLLKHRPDRVLHDVFHNVVWRVVGAGSFALTLVVL